MDSSFLISCSHIPSTHSSDCRLASVGFHFIFSPFTLKLDSSVLRKDPLLNISLCDTAWTWGQSLGLKTRSIESHEGNNKTEPSPLDVLLFLLWLSPSLTPL